MEKRSKEVRLTNSKSEFVVEYLSEDCIDDSQKRQRQIELLRTVADNPALLACGTELAQKITMEFVDPKWVIRLQSTGAST